MVGCPLDEAFLFVFHRQSQFSTRRGKGRMPRKDVTEERDVFVDEANPSRVRTSSCYDGAAVVDDPVVMIHAPTHLHIHTPRHATPSHPTPPRPTTAHPAPLHPATPPHRISTPTPHTNSPHRLPTLPTPTPHLFGGESIDPSLQLRCINRLPHRARVKGARDRNAIVPHLPYMEATPRRGVHQCVLTYAKPAPCHIRQLGGTFGESLPTGASAPSREDTHDANACASCLSLESIVWF